MKSKVVQADNPDNGETLHRIHLAHHRQAESALCVLERTVTQLTGPLRHWPAIGLGLKSSGSRVYACGSQLSPLDRAPQITSDDGSQADR